jgi:hypothetical protein
MPAKGYDWLTRQPARNVRFTPDRRLIMGL